MQEFAAVLGNAVTGLFAMLAAFFAWRLKKRGDDGDQETALAVEKRKMLSELYAHVFTSLEQAMKCAIDQEPFSLTEERSLINAKVRLLGSDSVNEAYDEVSEKLQTWSALYLTASPRKTRIGDQTHVTFQAPDPTAKYKAPAEEAHKCLHEALQELRERMRAELSDP